MPFSTIVPKAELVELGQILEGLRRGESTGRFETARLRKDGRTIVASVAITPIRDSTGRIIGAASIAHDVSEEKRVVEALARSEANFRGLFESAADGIFVDEQQGLILDATQAGEALVGRDR